MSGGNAAPHLLLIPFATGIGDLVMMEPLLRAVRTRLPGWRVTAVVRDLAADLFPSNGSDLVSPFYFVDRAPAPFRPVHRFIPQPWIAWAAGTIIAIDLGPVDRVINLFWIWESTTPFERWWMPRWPLLPGVRHTLDLMADHLERELDIRISPADRVPSLKPFPEASEWSKVFLRGQRRRRQRVAALVVATENSLKWWSVRKWADLNESLRRAGWLTLLLAPHGHGHAQRIHEACDSKPLWPATDLRQTAGLLARSDVVVGIDTGLVHMASALGTPWVGIFGPTNPDMIGPYDRSRGRTIVARFPKPPTCQDCWLAFKNRSDHCPTLDSTGCTTLIEVDEVISAIRAVRRGTRIA